MGYDKLANKTIVPIKYHDIKEFSIFDSATTDSMTTTMVGFSDPGDWRLYDAQGKRLHPDKRFSKITALNNDSIVVQSEEEWGLIDAKGEIMIPIDLKNKPLDYGYKDELHFVGDKQKFIFNKKTKESILIEKLP